jgi:CDP-4-dehydro-6-deoxyglucose reductase, E3
MPIPRHDIVCTEKELIAKDTYQLRFTRPENWTFKAGQFVLLDVPLLENPADIQTRAYSIGSEPGEQDILLAVKLKAGGRSSTWIERAVEVGTHATMQGPFGNFVLPAASHKPYLFLATGAGVAPFRAQIRELLRRDEQHAIDLVFGVRTEEELFWTEDFRELAKANPRFSLHVTLTRADDAGTGHKGRVQTLAPLIAPDVAERIVFACGNPDMTKEVKPLALEQWGVSKQDLHIEGFI